MRVCGKCGTQFQDTLTECPKCHFAVAKVRRWQSTGEVRRIKLGDYFLTNSATKQQRDAESWDEQIHYIQIATKSYVESVRGRRVIMEEI